MRVLVLCEGDAETHDSWSGVSRHVVTRLRSAGHEVVCGDVDLYGADRLAAAALTFSPRRHRWSVRYHLSEAPFVLRSRRAKRLIEAHGREIDIVLQFGATFETGGHLGVPYVLYCDSNIILAARGRASGQGEGARLTPEEIERIRVRESRVYENASCIMTFSDYLHESFRRDFGVPDSRLTTVYAGANLELSDLPPITQTAGVPTVLFVGRDFERKGGRVLLEAFGRVRDALPDAELMIVGPTDLRVSQPGVRVVGFLDRDGPDGWARLQALYGAAHVFVLPTRFEPFGIAFAEAMAFGLPCVGTTVWAVPEIVAHGETGLLVPVDDTAALTASMLALLKDPDRARKMGEAGRRRMERNFTWHAVAAKMVCAMEEVISGSLVPTS